MSWRSWLAPLLKHQRICILVKPYKCELCGRWFFFSPQYILNTRKFIQVKPFKYEECEKTFSDHSPFNLQKVGQAGLKSCRCRVWQTFYYPSCLKNPQRIHSLENPHKCGVCEKAFKSSLQHSNHLWIHSQLWAKFH